MDARILLDIESVSEMEPTVPKVAVEITRGCRLTLEWEEMFARHVTSLRKFKLKKQSCFRAKVNIMHIQRLQEGLNALVKYIEDNNLN